MSVPPNETGSLSDHEFPAQDDDFVMDGGDDVMGMDEDRNTHPPTVQDDSLRLSLSREDSKDGAAAAGISFGEDEDEEVSTDHKTKRKSVVDDGTKKKKKKKKRKVVTDFGHTELSSDHIRRMLADTSKIVRPQVHPATWVPGQSKKSALARTDRQLLRQYLSHEQLLQRPALGDDGQLAPELLALWERNAAPIRGEPFPYEMREDEEGEEEVEKARTAAEHEDEDLAPPADEDHDFPEADGSGDYPFPEEAGIPFDDTEDQIEMQDGGDDVMGGGESKSGW